MAISVRVVFSNLHCMQARASGQPAQAGVYLASRQTLGFRTADSGSRRRIESVEVDCNAKAVGRRRDDCRGLGQTRSEAAFADLVAADDANTHPGEELRFLGFPGTRPENDSVMRIELRPADTDVQHAPVALPQQTGQRHAVDGAGMRCFRGVAVKMGVNPQQAERRAGETRDAAPRADGDRVITADDQGKGAVEQRFADAVGKITTKAGDPANRPSASGIRRQQRYTPGDQRMVLKFAPGRRTVERRRPVFTPPVASADATGRADDANPHRHLLPRGPAKRVQVVAASKRSLYHHGPRLLMTPGATTAGKPPAKRPGEIDRGHPPSLRCGLARKSSAVRMAGGPLTAVGEPQAVGIIARARRITPEARLHHIFTGNVHDSEGGTTFCASCKAAMIVRNWYDIQRYDLDLQGRGPNCQTAIAGRFGPILGHDGRAFGPRRIPMHLGA